MPSTHLRLFALIAGCSAASSEPEACTPQFRRVKPRETGVHGLFHADHWVTSHPTVGSLLRVFLPGTLARPSGSSYLLNAIAECDKAVIGLSYGYLWKPDASRDEACARKYGSNTTGVMLCLENQHADVLWGGAREDDIFGRTAGDDSVRGRLALLLAYLDKNHPDEGWGRFLNSSANPPEPRWQLLLVGGHSQGAGHAGYLAQTTRLAGAALISGPQDDCIGCSGGTMWLQKDWRTRHVTAAKHANESAADVIGRNWRLMAGQLRWPAEVVDIGSGQEQLPYGALVSHLSPSMMRLSRPYHVSMAEDIATPVLAGSPKQAVYAIALWPSLFAEPTLPPTSKTTIVASGKSESILELLSGEFLI